MPYVEVKMIAGRSAEQKEAIARDITDSLVRHAGTPAAQCYVVFDDVATTDWMVGGKSVAQLMKERGAT